MLRKFIAVLGVLPSFIWRTFKKFKNQYNTPPRYWGEWDRDRHL